MTVAPTSLGGGRRPHRVQLTLIFGLVVIAAAVVLLVRHDVFQGSSGSTGTKGSGIAATQTREVAKFAGLDLAGSNVVTVRVGSGQSVVVRADHNLLGRITTVVQAGTLVIGNTGSFGTKTPMSVDVSVPSLDSITLSGSGIISVEGVETEHLGVTLSGSGVLRASGTVSRLDVSLGGSGDAQLEGLIARDVRAVVSGSGRILVTAVRTLDASVPGTGAIVYGGDPKLLTTSVTGTGAITRR